DAVDLARFPDRHVPVDDVLEHLRRVALPGPAVAAAAVRLECDHVPPDELLLRAEHAEVFLVSGALVAHHPVRAAVRPTGEAERRDELAVAVNRDLRRAPDLEAAREADAAAEL